MQWRKLLGLVSAFTVGHAISLALAYHGVVSIPASIVEPAIAASIVLGAVALRWESAMRNLTFVVAAIGALHGLGFAGSLASQGLIASNRWIALASFNVGIDIAQIAVVCVIATALVAAARVIRGVATTSPSSTPSDRTSAAQRSGGGVATPLPGVLCRARPFGAVM